MVEAHPRLKIVDEILAERLRQVDEEGWSVSHDDEHRKGELAIAAACYATNAAIASKLVDHGVDAKEVSRLSDRAGVPGPWPWDKSWWKPKSRRKNLVRAAALIIADIERIDRSGQE